MIAHLQAAMEYLMTYGWAILVIAVVLAVLFSLGVTNPLFFSPKAPPGSCQVVRPNGPGTTSSISLEGGQTCQQIPEYVASLNGKTNQYVSLGNNPAFSSEAGSAGALTFCMWYYLNTIVNYQGVMIKGQYYPSYGNNWEYTFDQYGIQGFTVWTPGGSNIAFYSTGKYPPINTWIFACLTFDQKTRSAYYYFDGNQSVNTGIYGTAATSTGSLIVGYGEHGPFSGKIANIQIYNAALSPSEIRSLYLEGIQGAPLNLQSLVGWWPLDGNTNDYSGNNNDGIASNIIWSGNWWQSYSAP